MNLIPVMKPVLTGNEINYVNKAIKSTWIGGAGEYVDYIEKEWAKICGVNECVTTANGTVALHMALLASGIGKGDEVILPSLTYVATANAVKYVGAKPVFVDVEDDSWCLDPLAIEKVITNKTKAVMPVHLLGHPANMDLINELSELHNLRVVVDAAQGHLGKYKGKTIGSLGEIETFSFHVGKMFTCGEGGAITLNDKKKAKWLRLIRGHGMDKKRQFYHTITAFNYRLTNMQCAYLAAQLENKDQVLNQRKNLFNIYNKYLKNSKYIKIRPICDYAELSPWMFAVTLTNAAQLKRDLLIEKLKSVGIESRRFYYPLPELPAFRDSNIKDSDYKNAKYLSENGLYLPSSLDLKEKDVEYITDKLHDFLK